MNTEEALNLLKEAKNNSHVFLIMKSVGFNADILKAGIPLLDLYDEDEIFKLIELSGNNWDFCQAIGPFLNLENKTQSELLQLIKRLDYCGYFCGLIIKKIREAQNQSL